jgi:hypothetical protein
MRWDARRYAGERFCYVLRVRSRQTPLPLEGLARAAQGNTVALWPSYTMSGKGTHT